MPITELPTKAVGSLGPKKTDSRAYVNPGTELPAIELEAIKSAIIELYGEVGLSDGSTADSINAAPSTSDELWKWNGTDLTQFTDGATPILDTAGGALLSFETGAHGQPVLRVTGGGSIGFAQWAINVNEFPSLPSRFVIETSAIRAENGSGGLSASLRVGVSFFCQYNSPTDVLAYSVLQHCNSNQTQEVVARNTSMALLGAGTGGQMLGTNAGRQGYLHKTEIDMLIGATFKLRWFHRGWGLASNQRIIDSDDGTMDMDSGAFNNQTPNTIGLCGQWPAAQAGFIDFTAFRILKHPMDITG